MIMIFPLMLTGILKGQGVIVTDDANYTTPASGAMMDVKSTTKGFMAPRVALTATNAASPLTLPSTELLVYNTATTSLIHCVLCNVMPCIFTQTMVQLLQSPSELL